MLFEKGNQLIYELDSKSRVISLFKETLSSLEGNLTQRILSEQLEKFMRQNDQVEGSKRKFNDYLTAIMSMIQKDFAEDEHKIKMMLKNKAEAAKVTDRSSLFHQSIEMYPKITDSKQ